MSTHRPVRRLVVLTVGGTLTAFALSGGFLFLPNAYASMLTPPGVELDVLFVAGEPAGTFVSIMVAISILTTTLVVAGRGTPGRPRPARPVLKTLSLVAGTAWMRTRPGGRPAPSPPVIDVGLPPAGHLEDRPGPRHTDRP